MSSGWTLKQLRQEVERLRLVADISERSKALLHFIERSNAFCPRTAAVEVFGREPGFEVREDPIVRIELARLAVALDRHYSREHNTLSRLVLRRSGDDASLELRPYAPAGR